MAEFTPDEASHAMLSRISAPFRKLCEAVAGELRHGDPRRAYSLVDQLIRSKPMGPTDRRCMIALRICLRAVIGLRDLGVGPELDFLHSIDDRPVSDRYEALNELAGRIRPAAARALEASVAVLACPNCGGLGAEVGWVRPTRRSGVAHGRFYVDVGGLLARELPNADVTPDEAQVVATMALADLEARVPVRQCETCRLRFVSVRQSAETLERTYAVPVGGGFTLAAERLSGRAHVLGFTYLKAALPLHLEKLLGDLRGQAVYDFGCAEGVMAAILSDLGAHVTGGDLDGPKVRYARKALGLDTLSESPTAFWSVEEDSLDGIVAFHTVEHLCNPDHYLRRFKSMLKPGGWLAVSVPRTVVAAGGQVAEMGGDHLIGFDEAILGDFLRRQGLDVIDVQVDDGALPTERLDDVLGGPVWAGRSGDVTIVARRPA